MNTAEGDGLRYNGRRGFDLRELGGDVIMDVTHRWVAAQLAGQAEEAARLLELRRGLERAYPAALAEIDARWPVSVVPGS